MIQKIDTKIFINTSYQIIGKVIISLLGVITTAFLSRFLGKNLFGEFSLIFAIIGIISVIPDFGLGVLLTREIASKRATREYFSHIFTIRLFLLVITSIIALIIVALLPYSMLVKVGFLIALIGAFFLSLSTLIWSVFQAELKFGRVVLVQVIASSVVSVCTVLGVYFHLSFLYYLLFNLIGNGIGFVISLWLFDFPADFFKVSLLKMKEVLFEAWPLGVGAVLGIAYFKVDSLMLSFYRNPALTPDLGLYSIAYKCFEVTLIFGGYFMQTLFPVFSKSLGTPVFKTHYKRYRNYTFGIGIVATLFLYSIAWILVAVLGGDSYKSAVPAVQILSLAVGFSIIASYFYTIAIAGGKQLLLLKFGIGALIFNIIINLYFIPQYSFIGASITTVATQGFILIVNYISSKRVVKENLI